MANEGADPERREALEAMGARVFCLPATNGLVNLEALLKQLGDMGINSLMVEGGAQIITSFLASRLVDQIILTIAPLLVGGLRVVDSLGRGALSPLEQPHLSAPGGGPGPHGRTRMGGLGA